MIRKVVVAARHTMPHAILVALFRLTFRYQTSACKRYTAQSNNTESNNTESNNTGATMVQGLLQHDPEALCPMVRNAIVAARHSVPHAILAAPTIDAASLSALLAKEAMYNAACCATYELFDHLDFKEWLDNSLLPDLLVVCITPDHAPQFATNAADPTQEGA